MGQTIPFSAVGLGADALVLPTTPMAGASGWIMATVPAPPNATVQSETQGTPNAQVWVQDSTKQLKLWGMGISNIGSVNWLTAGGTVTFYLLPVDVNGNVYAPVASLTVKGAPGIYPTPGVPPEKVTQEQANNPGINLYGVAPANTGQQQKTTSTDPLAFLDGLPGGRTTGIIGGVVLLVLLMKNR